MIKELTDELKTIQNIKTDNERLILWIETKEDLQPLQITKEDLIKPIDNFIKIKNNKGVNLINKDKIAVIEIIKEKTEEE